MSRRGCLRWSGHPRPHPANNTPSTPGGTGVARIPGFSGGSEVHSSLLPPSESDPDPRPRNTPLDVSTSVCFVVSPLVPGSPPHTERILVSWDPVCIYYSHVSPTHRTSPSVSWDYLSFSPDPDFPENGKGVELETPDRVVHRHPGGTSRGGDLYPPRPRRQGPMPEEGGGTEVVPGVAVTGVTTVVRLGGRVRPCRLRTTRRGVGVGLDTEGSVRHRVESDPPAQVGVPILDRVLRETLNEGVGRQRRKSRDRRGKERGERETVR